MSPYLSPLPPTWRRSLWIGAVVVLAHWGLLSSDPLVRLHLASNAAAPTVLHTQLLAPSPPAQAPLARQARQSAPNVQPAVQPIPRLSTPSPLDAPAPDLTTIAAPTKTEGPTDTDTRPNEPADAPTPASASTERASEPLEVAAARVAAPPEPKVRPAQPPIETQLPTSVSLRYEIRGEIKGFPVYASGELRWQQDSATYDARMEISHFLLGSRVQTSKGLIGPEGLEPVRFGDKVRSEVAAHFERSKGKVSYSANTPDEVLQPGAQDQLSIFMQLAGMLAAQPHRYDTGSVLSFQAVGPRSSETWSFKVAAPATIDVPAGSFTAVLLTKEPVHERDSRAEVWLATDTGYLPVRIRLTQSNGDFVDQRLRSTESITTAPPR